MSEAPNYYIPQYLEPFKSIGIGRTTVGDIGCAVCCCAMVMCIRLGVSDDDTKVDAVKKIISAGTNSSGDLSWDFSVTWKNEFFQFTRTTTKPNYDAVPVVQYEGHFILAISSTEGVDPGKGSSYPYSTNTIENYDAYYGTPKAWWPH